MAYKIIYFCGPKVRDIPSQQLQLLINSVHEMSIGPKMTGEITRIGGGVEARVAYMDFNCGLRLEIPEGNWHVTILDNASKVVFFDQDVSEVKLISAEKFFIRWEIALFLDGKLVFHHIFNPRGHNVHFQFCPTGMGDHIALFPCIETFRRLTGCNASFTAPEYLRELFCQYYPKVKFLEIPPQNSYATFYMTPTFHPLIADEQVRTMPMLRMGLEILGLYCADKIVYYPTKPRQIQEPYVCIAAQASSAVKTWLAPNGYDVVVAYLKKIGYRVICIDKDIEHTDHDHTARMPEGAEDFTGDLPLLERVNTLAYADFFIGFSSGLSWLAWAVDIPVILISGFTSPWCEFDTPYRIYNRLVCHGCHNDTSVPWSAIYDCPRHGGTERAYECSKAISAQQVIDAIDCLRNNTYKSSR